jgi:hypothetical protein
MIIQPVIVAKSNAWTEGGAGAVRSVLIDLHRQQHAGTLLCDCNAAFDTPPDLGYVEK